MRLTFLGTGSAEGFPAPFCRCENCEEARRRRGRSLRLRNALLINEDLLLDFNVHLIPACAYQGIVLDRVQTLLVARSQDDHLQVSELFLRKAPYTATPLPMLEIYGPPHAAALLSSLPSEYAESARFHANAVVPGDVWARGRYSFVALRATNGTETPIIYAVDDGQRRVLHATDTGPLRDETWTAIRGCTYDAVIIDETNGRAGTSSTHLGIDDVIGYRAAFEREGLLRDGGRFIATHFGHGANPCHEDLDDLLRPFGIEVAYDGWQLDL